MKRQHLLLPGVLLFLTAIAGRGETKATSPESEWKSLHALILPGPDDSQWMKVSWLPASNLWAARQRAAAEGKPLFLWYMAGEPLGPC